ncbi:MAG: hypothetical protein WCO64_02240 [Actinomycetes bacterium]
MHIVSLSLRACQDPIAVNGRIMWRFCAGLSGYLPSVPDLAVSAPGAGSGAGQSVGTPALVLTWRRFVSQTMPAWLNCAVGVA